MPRLLVAALLVVGSLLVTSPAQAAAFGVSLSISTTKADVGQTLRISGTVSGTGSAGAPVVVQRKVGTGAWARVGTVTTNGKRVYVLDHRVGAVGAQQFRAVVPKRGKTTAGVSSTRAFTGWTWLWLDTQPLTFSGGRIDTHQNPTVQGVKRPRTIAMRSSDHADTKVRFYPNGKCDRGDIKVGRYDGQSTSTAVVFQDFVGPGQTVVLDSPSERIATLTLVRPEARILEITMPGQGLFGTAYVLSPRVHCSVSMLSTD